MSSLQWHFGLPTDLMPFICNSVILAVIVHLLSFIWAMCTSHFHFTMATCWTMSVTLVPCLMMALQILSFSLALSFFLSMARSLVLSFFTHAFVGDYVWHPCAIAGKTYWFKAFLFRLMGRCMSRKISLYFPKALQHAFILIKTSCLVLFSIAIPRYLLIVTSISVPSVCVMSVVSIFATNLVLPLCILRPILKLSSLKVFNCSVSFKPSVASSSANRLYLFLSLLAGHF